MSATIDTDLFTNYFGTCPIIQLQGRTFPVQRELLSQFVLDCFNLFEGIAFRFYFKNTEVGKSPDFEILKLIGIGRNWLMECCSSLIAGQVLLHRSDCAHLTDSFR